MPNERVFRSDLRKLATRLDERGVVSREKLDPLIDKLVDLHRKGLVKINHSAMEIVVAAHFIARGYEVDVEVPIDDLKCDLLCLKGSKVIVEVETGYVPPEHALDPDSFCRARIASKIARYSINSDEFYLAAPPTYLMEIPRFVLLPPEERIESELMKWKSLLDVYYTNPPIPLEVLRRAKLNGILVTSVDEGSVTELSPITYVRLFKVI
ncbi:MAG: hypothetical protein QW187_05305 [Candidatus Korarchaeum sp.]